ncbi:MAG TPA: hypothetical protein VFW49_11890 [Fluviicoccus sp.]|nr:hypothetical protein [Fluviicoccus sp.]
MKKPVIIFTAAVAVLAGVAVVLGMWMGGDGKRSLPGMTTADHAAGSAAGGIMTGEQRPQNLNAPPAPAPGGTDSPLLPLEPSTVDAAVSMRESFLHGDPNAPKVVHDATPQEQATPEELADPKLYAQFEARQNMRLYKGYVAAAETEIPRLQQDIAKAKAMGLSKEQIAEGEEKLRRIQAMRDQLLSEHPEISR